MQWQKRYHFVSASKKWRTIDFQNNSCFFVATPSQPKKIRELQDMIMASLETTQKAQRNLSNSQIAYLCKARKNDFFSFFCLKVHFQKTVDFLWKHFKTQNNSWTSGHENCITRKYLKNSTQFMKLSNSVSLWSYKKALEVCLKKANFFFSTPQNANFYKMK